MGYLHFCKITSGGEVGWIFAQTRFKDLAPDPCLVSSLTV